MLFNAIQLFATLLFAIANTAPSPHQVFNLIELYNNGDGSSTLVYKHDGGSKQLVSKPKTSSNAKNCPSSIGDRSSCFDASSGGYNCICFVQRNMFHPTAKSYCQAGGMTLLSVQTKEKQQFVLQLKNDNNIALSPEFHMWWIGGSDWAQEGHWVWNGGAESGGEPFTFYDWGFIQPDGWRWQNNMALLNSNFKFFDWPLFWPAFAICEN